MKLALAYLFLITSSDFVKCQQMPTLSPNYFVKLEDLNVNKEEWQRNLMESNKVNNNKLCLAKCSQLNYCGMVALEPSNYCSLYNATFQSSPYSSLYESSGTVLYHKGTIPQTVKESIEYLNGYLTHQWKFDNDVKDLVGGADLYGGPTTGKSFTPDRFNRLNSALYLQLSYYEMPSGVYVAGDYSVLVWVKMNSFTGWARIFQLSLSAYSGVWQYYSVSLVISNSAPNPTMQHSLNNTFINIVSTVALQTSKWQHVAFTLRGSIGTIFIDGQQTVQGTIHVPPNMIKDANRLGCNSNNGLSRPDAEYDNLMIFNKSLSAFEIKKLMNL